MAYRSHSVNVPFDTESELYRRIVAIAAEKGTTVDKMIDALVVIGINGHVERNLKALEAREK